jgi:hypothetical protein
VVGSRVTTMVVMILMVMVIAMLLRVRISYVTICLFFVFMFIIIDIFLQCDLIFYSNIRPRSFPVVGSRVTAGGHYIFDIIGVPYILDIIPINHIHVHHN